MEIGKDSYKGSYIEKGISVQEITPLEELSWADLSRIEKGLEEHFEKGNMSEATFDNEMLKVDIIKAGKLSDRGRLKPVHIIDKNGKHTIVWKAPEDHHELHNDASHKMVKPVQQGDTVTYKGEKHTLHKIKDGGYWTLVDKNGKKHDKSPARLDIHNPRENWKGATDNQPKDSDGDAVSEVEIEQMKDQLNRYREIYHKTDDPEKKAKAKERFEEVKKDLKSATGKNVDSLKEPKKKSSKVHAKGFKPAHHEDNDPLSDANYSKHIQEARNQALERGDQESADRATKDLDKLHGKTLNVDRAIEDIMGSGLLGTKEAQFVNGSNIVGYKGTANSLTLTDGKSEMVFSMTPPITIVKKKGRASNKSKEEFKKSTTNADATEDLKDTPATAKEIAKKTEPKKEEKPLGDIKKVSDRDLKQMYEMLASQPQSEGNTRLMKEIIGEQKRRKDESGNDSDVYNRDTVFGEITHKNNDAYFDDNTIAILNNPNSVVVPLPDDKHSGRPLAKVTDGVHEIEVYHDETKWKLVGNRVSLKKNKARKAKADSKKAFKQNGGGTESKVDLKPSKGEQTVNKFNLHDYEKKAIDEVVKKYANESDSSKLSSKKVLDLIHDNWDEIKGERTEGTQWADLFDGVNKLRDVTRPLGDLFQAHKISDENLDKMLKLIEKEPREWKSLKRAKEKILSEKKVREQRSNRK